MSSPRQGDQRPRSSTRLSFASNKSHRSSGSLGKLDLTESPKDKRHLNTKADPTLAINEAQPSAIALESSNLESLRAFQHRDMHGNIITDPDRSNPTRHRMERPLDTIRSFEAAIDGSYKRRVNSYQQRPESGQGLNGPFDSRRSSFFALSQQNGQGRGYQEPSYYGNRNSMNRPDSFIDHYTGQPQNPPGQGRPFRSIPRMNSEPMVPAKGNQQNVYPSYSNPQSYDTVNTSASGGGSHQTDMYGNSTDPSSENSSIDRIQQVPKQTEQQPNENYSFIGFGGSQYQNDYVGNAQGGYGVIGGQGQAGPSSQNRFERPQDRPMPPPKEGPRVPIKLNGFSGSSPLARQVSTDASNEKRKSWFKRRFSKN